MRSAKHSPALERHWVRVRHAIDAALLVAAAAPLPFACSGGPRGADDTVRPDAAGEPEAGSADASDEPSPTPCPSVVPPQGENLIQLDAATDAADEGGLCQLSFPCGLPTGLSTIGCAVVNGDATPFGCVVAEEAGCEQGVYHPPESGGIMVRCACDLFTGGGRRPAGMRFARRSPLDGGLGGYLARLAEEEAASILAFERLKAELERLRAPADLVTAAEFSVGDERRHARAIARLARRHGRSPQGFVARAARRRDLEEVAHENAVEGCVRETYGALLARWQASHAADAELARAFALVARDEANHAALAWAIDAWSMPLLNRSGRRRVLQARQRAVRALLEEVRQEPSPTLVALAGLPSATQGVAMVRAMNVLWSARRLAAHPELP